MNKIVVANMKMNLTIEEISEYLKVINKEVTSKRVIFCPTSIYIPYFLKHDYSVGIQNTFIHESGAYTGEISPKQAALMGINYTIIGHSERRLYFKETDSLIAEKVKDAVNNNLGVILCIGETLEEKNMLKTNRILKRQLINALRDLEKEMIDNIVIAYEPVWSIGSGKVPSNKEIESIVEYIKMIVKEAMDYDNIPVLYGGSVNEKNIKELNKMKSIVGFLIGGASTDANKMLTIIEEVIK